MDPTTPDPQPQQQQQLQQQPQQQQPQQQPSHGQQQPPQQHHQHVHAHQHPNQTAQPYPPMSQFQHQYSYQHQFAAFGSYPMYPYAPHQAWTTPTHAPANYNMVNQQPKSNVPQQHNKPPAPGVNAERPQNQNLQFPNQVTTTKRARQPATLKDPHTLEVVPLDDSNTAKTSSSTSKPLPNVSATTATIAPAEHVHKLLQHASGADDGVVTNNKQQQHKGPTVVSDMAEDNNKKVNKTEAPLSSNKATTTTTVTTNNAKNTTNASVPHEAIKDNEKSATKVGVVNKPKEKSPSPPKQAPTEQTHQQHVQAIKIKKGDGDLNSHASDNVQSSEDKETEKDDHIVFQGEGERDCPSQEVVVESSIPEAKKVNGNEAGDDSNKENSKSEVTLKYQPWQFNPKSNREGRKIYSNEFLRSVERLKFDAKLDSFYSESDNTMGIESNRLPELERIDHFAPSYSSGQRFALANRQNEPARRQSQHNYVGRGSAGGQERRIVITSSSLTQEVELKTVSNPWKPTKESKETAPADEVETESLKKKFRSILNKLTPNNFESLSAAVNELNVDTESKLGEVIDIVFAKALAEPGYCVLYGQMCSTLKKTTAGQANFGNTLLKRCQNQFQSDIYSGLNLDERKKKIDNEQDPEIKKQLNEELYEDMYRCRMRGLGLIKFIGELYKIEMLNDAIMFACISRLLQDDKSEESLECLCDLLVTIGGKLDKSSQKNGEKEKKTQKGASKTNAYQGSKQSLSSIVAGGQPNSQQKSSEQQNIVTLDQVFEKLHKIRKDKELPLSIRIRFKLLDTCDLREKDNWQSKKAKDNNPKKIEEIREAHKEKLEQERKQNAAGPRRSQEGRRGLGHSSGSSSQISSLANESGGNRGTSNMHTSSSSHLIRDHSVGDNMKTNNDIEEHKEHQKKLEDYKKLTTKVTAVPVPDALRPYGLRLMNKSGAFTATPNSSSNAPLTAKAKSPDV